MLRNDDEVPLPNSQSKFSDPTEHAMSMFMDSDTNSSSKGKISVQNIRGNVSTLLNILFSSERSAIDEASNLQLDAILILEAVLEKPKLMKHVSLLKVLVHLSSCLCLLSQNREKYVSGFLRLELDPENPTIYSAQASLSKCAVDKCTGHHRADRFENVDTLRHSRRGDYRRLRWVIWLMDASVTFGQVARESHSVILASGTLHPMDALLSELGNDFNRRLRRVSKDVNAPVRLRTYQGMHVLENQKKQLWVAAVGCGPLGQVRLNGSNRKTSSGGKNRRKRGAQDFFNRNRYRKTPQALYYEEVGHALVEICEVTPGGVVVFAPSYAKLNGMVKSWKRANYSNSSDSIWDRLSEVKCGSEIVVEPRSSTKTLSSRGDSTDNIPLTLEAAHEMYASGVYSGDGALMLAVFRGKMSEGMDLKDAMVRCVVCVGIPYPNSMDLNVRVKMTYNDIQRARYNKKKINTSTRGRRSGDGQEEEMYFVPLDGWSWYRQAAFQAVNQAVGRVHRHPKDYGSIILLDDRYNDISSQSQIKPYLSRWYRDVVKRSFIRSRFAEIKFELSNFFTESVPLDIRVDGVMQCKRDGNSNHITPEYDEEDTKMMEVDEKSSTSKRPLEESKYIQQQHGPNKKPRPMTECVICLDGKARYACVPCGHLCICVECVSAVVPEDKTKGLCPVCRAESKVQRLIFC